MKTTEHFADATLPRTEEGQELRVGSYVFKRASTEEELQQVHELNHRTFASEIRQHDPDPSGRLIDKFHEKNTYFVAKRQGRVIAMIAVHSQPPFSVADKLDDPARMDAFQRPLEVRLLAIEQNQRNGPVFAGLNWVMIDYAVRRGFSHLLISGLQDRISLYERMGFRGFAPARRSGDAWFVPMSLDLVEMPPDLARDVARWGRHLRHSADKAPGANGADGRGQPVAEPVHFLPGPVQMTEQVRRALREAPLYHRCDQFDGVFQQVRESLLRLVGGDAAEAGDDELDVALFSGSGTLANEVVAATLAADRRMRRGLILVNGEFGQRLVNQARRHGLVFDVVERPWGQPWSLDTLDAIECARQEYPDINWVWAVHLETSTGMLNDLPALLHRAGKAGLHVCLDCISSLGATPVDLTHPQIHLATSTSGKALGGAAGVAMVFARRQRLREVNRYRVPAYLDLVDTLGHRGPRFTFPSQPILALAAALEAYETEAKCDARYRGNAQLGALVRRRLREMGLSPLVDGQAAAPVITTFQPPAGLSSLEVVEACRQRGLLIGGESGYLKQRGWLQIANMGAVTQAHCDALFDAMAQICQVATKPRAAVEQSVA